MLFERTTEQQALIDSATRFVADQTPGDAAGTGDPGQHRLRWQLIAELGWLALSVDESHGGLGLPWSMASQLIEALGPAALNEPLISHLSLVATVLNAAQPGERRDGLLEALINGEVRLALAHHERRDGRQLGFRPQLRLHRQAQGYVLEGKKCAVIDADGADWLLVSCLEPAGEQMVLVAVPVTAAGAVVDVAPGFDGRSIADISFAQVTVAAGDQLAVAAPVDSVIDQALAAHALLLASESLGISRTLLNFTHEYLSQREQFGGKLFDLQVLQHRLVDMQLALTRFESQLELARFKVDELGLGPAARFIDAARVQATQAGRYIGQQAVQLHGAIGMTDELVVGRYLRRLTANGLASGTSYEHLERLSATLRGGVA